MAATSDRTEGGGGSKAIVTGGTTESQVAKLIGKDADIARDTLARSLVLDYLSHANYVSTARILSKEAATPIQSSSSTDAPSNVVTNGDHAIATTTTSADHSAGPSAEDGDVMMQSVGNLRSMTVKGDSDAEADGNGEADGTEAMDVDDRVEVEGTVGSKSHGDGLGNVEIKDDDHKEGLLSEKTLEEMQRRKDICDHIINGEISEAIQSIRENFPDVLDTTRKSKTANGFAATDDSEATTGSADSDSPAASPQSPSGSLPSSPELPPLRPHFPAHVMSDKGISRNAATGTSTGGSTSTTTTASGGGGGGTGTGSNVPPFPYAEVFDRPDFLSINLDIQQFVESLRHLVIPSSPSSMASSIHSDSPFAGPTTGAGGGNASGAQQLGAPTMKSSSNSTNGFAAIPSSTGRDTAILQALSRAQHLHATAKSLSPQESRAYLKEIENVCALLAYTDMEGSPLRGYLDQGRRIALARQVNSAILVHTGHAPQAILETTAKHTTSLWKAMTDHGISVMPDWTSSREGPDWERLASFFRFRRNFDLSDFLAEQ